MQEPRSLQEAIAYFADPERAFQYAVSVRWPDGNVTCPRCGQAKHSFVKTRKLWFCYVCKKQFTAKVGTVMEDSPIGLDKWMVAFWMLANCKNGVSSYELHRALKVRQQTAWFMLHRIREAMRDESVAKFGGSGRSVEADETFVGPNPYKMHKSRKLKLQQIRGQQCRGDVYAGKTAVAGILDRETRKVRAKVVPNVRRDTLQAAILNSIAPGSKLYTDDAATLPIPAGSIGVHSRSCQPCSRGHCVARCIPRAWIISGRSSRGRCVEPTYVSSHPILIAISTNRRFAITIEPRKTTS